MPTYAYRCTACAHEFEAFQKFSDDPLTACPACGEHVRRVLHPVGIVFKGSGWYITDSRNASSSSLSANGKSGGDSGEAKESPAAKETSTPATTAAAAD